MADHVTGIAASKGIAIAKAFVLENPEFNVASKTSENQENELRRLKQALDRSKSELEDIKVHAAKELGEDKAEIFAAHLLVLQDPEFIGAVQEKIKNQRLAAESAVNEVASMFIDMFENMENEYMKERAADIRDVSKRLLARLLGVVFTSPAGITEEVVIIAEDLTPSDTAQLNRKYVQGFTTDIGGRTSHSAIMARSMEIPAVVGTKGVTKTVKTGTPVILDGVEGTVIVDPTEEMISSYEQKRAEFEAQQQELQKLTGERTVTKNGNHVELAANIGSPDDLDTVLSNGAEGIGLYRTEFLYMGREALPSEEEQLEAYKVVLEKMEGKPVVIRTLDIGGDKELPYLDLPKELNPFLGFRAIRLCLEQQDIFRTQLRALLRASAFGNLKVMFPMIATLDEFTAAKAILLEERDKLTEQGIRVADSFEIGMMVEIPAAAVMAPQFAKEVDFFSVGTNDLIQYTMAADRMNERVSYLYQPYSPAILQLVHHVITAAHNEGKWVGMCGEMAGDPIAIPNLLGLGLDEFSMSASSILAARSQIRNLSTDETANHAEKMLTMRTNQEVVNDTKATFEL